MKKIALLLAALAALPLTSAAQTRYERTYTDSKQLSVEGTMDASGRRDGEWRWWYPSGRISQQGTYSAGKKTGVWTVYYEDGNRMSEECHSGDGVSRSWYRNGDLQSEVNVRNGRREGTYRSWHKNGQLQGLGESVSFKANITLCPSYFSRDKLGELFA